jgi:hypothetical protein
VCAIRKRDTKKGGVEKRGTGEMRVRTRVRTRVRVEDEGRGQRAEGEGDPVLGGTHSLRNSYY